MTVVEYLKKNKVTSVADAKEIMIGKKVKILATTTAYGKKGESFTINNWSNPNNSSITDSTNISMLSHLPSTYMYLKNVEIIETHTISGLKEEISKSLAEIGKLNAEIEMYENKIKFMEENDLKEFDEDEFKVYHVLCQLKKKGSDIDKAKAIAKLIKG